MKFGRMAFPLLLVLILGALGCGKGDTGPTGPAGPAGPSVVIAYATVTTSGSGATVNTFGGSKTTGAAVVRDGVGLYTLTFTGSYGTITSTDDVAAFIALASATTYESCDMNWASGGGAITPTTLEMGCFTWTTESGSAVDVDGTTFTVVLLSNK